MSCSSTCPKAAIATSSSFRSALPDAKDQNVPLARARLQLVTGLIGEIGNIDGAERIRAFGNEHIAGLEGGERLAGAQRRQRAFEPAQIDGLLGHLFLEVAMPGDNEAPQRIVRLTPLADVLARIDALVKPVDVHAAVELAAAHDRTLSHDIVIERPIPAAALALRDGWAVQSDLTADAGAYAP